MTLGLYYPARFAFACLLDCNGPWADHKGCP
jgi:hypothetical protein